MELKKEYIQNIIYILIVALIFFCMIFLINLYNIDVNEVVRKKLLQVVTFHVEGMNNNNNLKNNSNSNNSKNNNNNCDCSNNNTNSGNSGNNSGSNNGNNGNINSGGNDVSANIPEEPLLLSPTDMINADLQADFCKSFEGSSDLLEKECNNLTTSNCKSSSCCVLLNGKKCVAGNANGPTFLTNTSGESINADFYYYQNKCYGNGCPVGNNIVSQLLTQVE